MTPHIRLSLLGPAEVELDGARLRGFESRKALALVCYLASHRVAVPRSDLAHIFWPDRSESRGRANLSRVLTNLTSLLPETICADLQKVRFRVEAVEVDAAEFVAWEARGDPQSLARASELYRGDFLEGLDLDRNLDWQHWLESERAGWRRRAADILHRLAEHHTRRREHEAALRFAVRLLELEPWREETHRLLMRLLTRTGERSAAVAQYENCRRLLAGELGVDPSPETEALYERLLAERTGHRHNLPVPLTPFVGRREELATIAEIVADPDRQLLTLVGPGGVGKTRLALEAAAREIGAFLDGVFFVSLSSVQSGVTLCSALADAIDYALYGHQNPLRQLASHLADKELLLLLDPFEHLVGEGYDVIRTILDTAPDVALLITSRQRLDLDEAVAFEIRGLPFPSDPGDEEAARYDSVVLFRRTARRLNPAFEPSGGAEASIARFCRIVEGLPLAIELGAAETRNRTLKEIISRIDHDLGSLRAPFYDLPRRQQSLRSVLDDSWERLTTAEQAVFRRLSVFQGGFGELAARAIAGADRKGLDSLADKSFLRRGMPGRYAMHDLLRQYGQEVLAKDPEEQDRIIKLHCRHYLDLAERLGRAAWNDGSRDAHDQLIREMANVRAALLRAANGGATGELRRAVGPLFTYLDFRGRYREGEELLDVMIPSLDTGIPGAEMILEDRLALGDLLIWHGWFLCRLQLADQALSDLERGLELLRGHGTGDELEWALGALGMAEWLLGLTPQAIAHLEEAREVGKRASDPWHICHASAMLGMVLESQGKYKRARAYASEGLQLAQEWGHHHGMTLAYTVLARIARSVGEHEEARELYRTAIERARQSGHVFGLTLCLDDLAGELHREGEDQEAVALYQEAIDLCREIDEKWGLARALTGLGDLYLDLDQPELARECLEAFQNVGVAGSLPLVLNALLPLAKLSARERDWKRAEELLQIVLHHPATEALAREQALTALTQLGLDPISTERSAENRDQAVARLETLIGSFQVKSCPEDDAAAEGH